MRRQEVGDVVYILMCISRSDLGNKPDRRCTSGQINDTGKVSNFFLTHLFKK